jgi:hypothetical protein
VPAGTLDYPYLPPAKGAGYHSCCRRWLSCSIADKKTLAHELGEALSGMTDHYLLMTATPHKGGPTNGYDILTLRRGLSGNAG